METLSKVEILSQIIEDVDQDMNDEETIHLILEKNVSQHTDSASQKKLTFGDRAADSFAKFVGSWVFIIGFCAFLAIWIGVNIVLLSGAFDPFPFILLNLLLSCLAAIQAPLIMMSQNRQEEKDRLRAENDYKVNLKSEIIMQDLHSKMDLILENQRVLMERLDEAGEAGNTEDAEDGDISGDRESNADR